MIALALITLKMYILTQRRTYFSLILQSEYSQYAQNRIEVFQNVSREILQDPRFLMCPVVE